MEKYFEYLSGSLVEEIASKIGTPVYIYDERTLKRLAEEILAFPRAYGFLARYAMKANSNRFILKLFDSMGLHFDASSGYEAERALSAGILPEKIQITAQEYPHNINELIKAGVLFNASSCHQLEQFGHDFPGNDVSVRINPGIGSGHNNRTNVGGLSSSFGIWHEWIRDVKGIAERYKLRITKVHTHIGSGGDARVWERVAQLSLDSVKHFPAVHTLNLGGGFKVARTQGEKTTNIQIVGESVKKAIQSFAKSNKRKLNLEIEPGTYLVAESGVLLASVMDKVSTGKEGYTFLKLDTGMNDMTRSTLYGSIHPVKLYPQKRNYEKEASVVIVGHCCESGDIFTPIPGDPEGIEPVKLPEAHIGDLLAFGAAGAYCSSMSLANYNSFPRIPEVLIRSDGELVLVRKRETIDHMISLECEDGL
ncbi:MAG TPA: diaminopimelate decarboxylase [Candidatus Marinimicrobia bacterium]|nr:diaminopimelate decarboxylase [Candidatus Neomarinimicrobiota bacterium]